MGVTCFVVGLVLLALTATLLTALLRLHSAPLYLLGTYLIGWAVVTLTCLGLSTAGWLTRVGVLVALASIAVCVAAAWWLRGRPRPPVNRLHVDRLMDALRDPILAPLAAIVALAYAYIAALSVFTPQNDGDPLVYELTRGALWRQNSAIGLVNAAFEPRLDFNPIVAEVGQLATMVLSGSERFVGVGQFGAVGALCTGVYWLARRVGLDMQPALFGALVVPTFPVVATQAWGAGNDLVLASFVVAVAAFGLGHTRAELGFVGLAAALAVGTKFTAPLILPAAALVVVTAVPRRRAAAVLATIGAGAVLGSGWYVANLVRTGELDGGLAESLDQQPGGGVGGVAYSASRLLLDSFDASGAVGPWASLYLVAGIGLAVALYRTGARPAVWLAAMGVVAFAPFVASLAGHAAGEAAGAAWSLRGDSAKATELRGWDASTAANGWISWYGPATTVLVGSTLCVAAWRLRRRRGSSVAVAMAGAPVLTLLAIASAITYDGSRGRFFAAPIAMSAALWGVTMDRRWLSGALACVFGVTLALVLVNAQGKPSGLQAGWFSRVAPIWALERWEAQTVLRPGFSGEGERQAIRFVQAQLPADAGLALALRTNDFVFPYFGADLERRIELLDEGESPGTSTSWMVLAAGRTVAACSRTWRIAQQAYGWSVWQRVSDRAARPACRMQLRAIPRVHHSGAR